ncbi:aminotransferase-like domain-containing protein [Falsigemmobacter faecalis]|uniref:GntR family transcriptional regulator n=1 Tax=Falsigemmobacter faecalis TaxID=2488730 RepID=A0A3P3DPT1_9RHOB|nr:GntR family transcriptional regulator [Falsigemmobacter faecalis]RRH76161.1 GntR family transcriptional regulator [Falsigemmobacter faecalis]
MIENQHQTSLSAAELAAALPDRTLAGITMGLRALIKAGRLPLGSRLPTVREVALECGVSPATISAVWQNLQKQKLIESRGRNGCWICGQQSRMTPARFASSGHFSRDVLNLSLAVPDARLLPPLQTALLQGAQAEDLNSYERIAILPALERAARRLWPYEPEALLATSGGYSAIHTLFHALSFACCRVAVEEPTGLRHLDILEDLGCEILPVATDSEGPLPESLARALHKQPVAFLFEPRQHAVTGQRVTPARLAALGDVLEGRETLIIEDDGIGSLSSVAAQSLGGRFPERVIHVLSFSKSHGPDLRMAVLSGPAEIVESIRAYRLFSSGWSSRILQGAAAWLLEDAGTSALVTQAREIYNARHSGFVTGVQALGGACQAGAGLSAWLPVRSETFAVVTFAAHGIAVSPGRRYGTKELNHVRIGTSTLEGDLLERVVEISRLASQ